MRVFLILSQAVAIIWATAVYFTGLSLNPTVLAIARACCVWSGLVGLLAITDLAISYVRTKRSWLWGTWGWTPPLRELRRYTNDASVKTEREIDNELVRRYEPILEQVAESENFPGVLTRAEGIVLSRWLDNMRKYLETVPPSENPVMKYFHSVGLDLVALVYAILPARDLAVSIDLSRGGKTLEHHSAKIQETDTPPTATHTVDAVKMPAISDKTEEYKKFYGAINFKNVEDEQLAYIAYAIVDKLYGIIVNAARDCALKSQAHTAATGLAAALADVDGRFLADAHRSANRYIINHSSLRHFAELPGFAPDAKCSRRARCGWYLARPILASTEVPENEVLCIASDSSLHRARNPILFASDQPITVNPDGVINIVGSVHVKRPERIRRIVLP